MTTVVVPGITDEEILANRAKWTAALRSGDYKQTSGALATKTYDAFCCLGVACEVFGAQYGIRRELVEPQTPDSEVYAYDNPNYDPELTWDEPVAREYGELPSVLYTPLGLTYADQTKLAMMNDGAGDYDQATFESIADYIDSLPISREMYPIE